MILYQRHRLIAVTFVLISLFLTACGSGSGSGSGSGRPLPGTIVGKVVDDQGQALSEVRVEIPNTPVKTYTNNAGMYTLQGIPNGTWPLLASKPGYRRPSFGQGGDDLTLSSPEAIVLSEDPSAGLYTYVTVDGHGVNAPTIQLIPYEAGADDVTMTHLSLPASAVLQAEDNQTLNLEVFYVLESASEGAVIAGLNYGPMFIAGDSQPVSAGQGSLTISLPFTVPHTPYVTLQVVLLDQYGVLASTSQQLFQIANYKEPKAPRLRLDSVYDNQIVLTWSNENYVNFKSLKLYRLEYYTEFRSSGNTLVGPENGTLIATFTDPEVTTYVDTDFIPGEAFSYAAVLETLDGQLIANTSWERLIVSTIDVPKSQIRINSHLWRLIPNPSYNQLYAFTRSGGEVHVVSMATKTVEKTLIPCGVTWYGQVIRHAASTDGSRLYVLCQDEQRVGAITFPHGELAYIDGLTKPEHLVVNPVDDSLLVLSRRDSFTGVGQVLKIHSDLVQQEWLPLKASGPAIGLPGNRLLAPQPTTTLRSAIYDLDTGEILHAWDGVSAHALGTAVHVESSALYTEYRIYRLPDGEWVGMTPELIHAASKDGSILFGSIPPYIIVYKFNGYAWSQVTQFPFPVDLHDLPHSYPDHIVFDDDTNTLYIAAGPRIIMADLSPLELDK